MGNRPKDKYGAYRNAMILPTNATGLQFKYLGLNYEITVRQFQTTSGVTVVSIKGTPEAVQAFARSQNVDPSTFVMVGNNAPSCTAAADIRVHLAFIDTNDTNGQTTEISRLELASFRVANFAYVHLATRMTGDVMVMVSDRAIYGNQDMIAITFGQFTDLLLDGTSNVLLIGNEGPRVMYGKTVDGQVTQILSDFRVDIGVRHCTTDTYLVEGEFCGKKLNFVDIAALTGYLEGQTDKITWFKTEAEDPIQDISALGNGVLVTMLADGDLYYTPATFTNDGTTINLAMVSDRTTKGADIGDFTEAPIVRFAMDTTVTVGDNGLTFWTTPRILTGRLAELMA